MLILYMYEGLTFFWKRLVKNCRFIIWTVLKHELFAH